MPEATQPRTVADAPPTCDQADCGKLAVFSYLWDWGQQGVCCAHHQLLLQQTSEPLNRKISFAPLLAPGPVPLARDERARLKGEVYAAEAEIEDLKGRGLDLYRENTKLSTQVQALTVRGRETEAQLRDASVRITQLEQQLQDKDAEHGNLVDEVERLRSLTKFSAPTREELGLVETEPSRVEGTDATRGDGKKKK